jgi:ATP-dependent exoDNAse (exonuclease V) beta subunit
MKPPPDQSIRDRVRTDYATTIVLEAGAGTGKTTVLVDRLVNLVLTGTTTLDRVVAITFTEAAAGELKMRLRDALEGAIPSSSSEQIERLSQALVDLERAHVSTIHAFASALLRERPFEAGVDPGFEVIADVAGRRTFDDTWNEWIDERLAAGDDVLMGAVNLGLAIADLQRAARIAVNERDVLGLPVERRPVSSTAFLEEITTAVAGLKATQKHCVDESDAAFVMVEELDERVRHAARLTGTALELFLRRLKITAHKGSQNNWEPKSICTDVKGELRRLKERVEAWVEEADADVNASLRERLLDLLQRYEEKKSESALADFQDLLLRARDVMVRSIPVRRYFQAKFDRILVDEFQDTDPLQAELVAFLAEDPATPPASDWHHVSLLPGKLFIVGDPKQSIYRFRRADLKIYEEVKALVRRCGGEVLPLTANFRTLPSIIGFINERFREIFAEPNDPEPIDLQPYREELDAKGARTVSLTVPVERVPEETGVAARRAAVAETIAAFVSEVTETKPWTVYDRDLKKVRSARPGDVAILVRKMTPEFIAPFEEQLRAREVSYRLVGGKEYFARDEVRALASVLRAIDNPADRLSLVQALRSPFFAVSDADLFQFVSSGGVLNINAPQDESVQTRDLFEPIFKTLTRLHRLRRIESPSVIIEELFSRTRALPAFLARPSGAQAVANLWKVLETARAYEAVAPATLRAFVRFLQDEEASSQAEGDSPVGEPIGASVEIVTVHKAKGLEYPIVIVADLFTNRVPAGECIIDHAAGRGWLKIGKFKPDGWEAQEEIENREQDAEGRRLLYVASTRARDYLVVPCLPGVTVETWLAPLANRLVCDVDDIPFGGRRGDVSWFDSRRLAFGIEPPAAARGSSPLDGAAADARRALAEEGSWLEARRSARDAARTRTITLLTSSDTDDSTDHRLAGTTGAQRLYGLETEGSLDEVSTASQGQDELKDREPASFGLYVHDILSTVDLGGHNLEKVARTLSRPYGFADADVLHAVDIVRRTLSLPIVKAARNARRLFREVPIAGTSALGRTQGKVDLLFDTGAGWRAVDFKTDKAASADVMTTYSTQMTGYAATLSGVLQQKVAASVCLVRSGELVECSAAAGG